jgi:hypothetical protein
MAANQKLLFICVLSYAVISPAMRSPILETGKNALEELLGPKLLRWSNISHLEVRNNFEFQIL